MAAGRACGAVAAGARATDGLQAPTLAERAGWTVGLAAGAAWLAWWRSRHAETPVSDRPTTATMPALQLVVVAGLLVHAASTDAGLDLLGVAPGHWLDRTLGFAAAAGVVAGSL